MTSIIIQRIGGVWHFNGRLYKDLNGKEKTFMDQMLKEVKIERLQIVRTPNSNLKRHNYKFKFREQDFIGDHPDIGRLEFIKAIKPNLFKNKKPTATTMG